MNRFLNGTSLPGDVVPLRLNQPNYGQTRPENYLLPEFPSSSNDQLSHGAYVLNEMMLGDFTFVGGVRFDSFRDTGTFTGDFEDDTFTFRVGGIYKPRDNVSIFAQWADSYVPQQASQQDPRLGGPFDPTKGTIIEGGVKASLFDNRFFVTLPAYDIKRRNVLQQTNQNPGAETDPTDFFDDFASIGEVTSTGVELEFIGDVTPDWVVTAAYAYNDVRITEDNGGGGFTGLSAVGDRFVNAPEHQFGFWTRYQVPSINTAFAFGGDYVSDRVSFAGQRVQPYFIADASVIWDIGDFEMLLRVNNLFDKTYAASGFAPKAVIFPATRVRYSSSYPANGDFCGRLQCLTPTARLHRGAASRGAALRNSVRRGDRRKPGPRKKARAKNFMRCMRGSDFTSRSSWRQSCLPGPSPRSVTRSTG